MSKKLKILVIRFSSIGDIILTTPIIRCLKQQLNSEVDFLTKNKYERLLVRNPNIREIFTLSDSSEYIMEILRSKEYDFVVDLQGNLRSFKLRLALGVKSFVFSKENLKRYILIYFGIDLLNNHIVDRYFKTVNKLNVYNDNKGLDYFLPDSCDINFNINQDYICWCIGGAHERKKLSVLQISDVISQLEMPVILLGASKEKALSTEIMARIKSDNLYDFCGETSIEESAYLVQNSSLVLTNDTGMMHIASAFDTPIISFWGCTKPSLGFGVYMPKNISESVITHLSEKPCSKHGKYCKFKSKGCIKEIASEDIYKAIKRLLK